MKNLDLLPGNEERQERFWERENCELVPCGANSAEIFKGGREEIDADDIKAALIAIARRCMQAEPVKLYDREKKEWVNSGEWKFDAKGALKALELLGESCGMYGAGGKDFEMPEVVIKVISE